MLKSLMFAVLMLQVLVPDIHAYKNITVTINGSKTALKGSVYVSIDGGVRGKICGNDHDWKLASVVCRQLGHGPPVTATTKWDAFVNNYYEDDFNCEGREKSLSECYKSNSYFGFCYNDFLEVECLPSVSQDYDIRLVPDDSEGPAAVLVFFGGRWGPICSSDYNLPDVICKQLGYTGDDPSGFYYGAVSVYEDPVLRDGSCSSWYTNIQSCGLRKWYASSWTGPSSCGDHVEVECTSYGYVSQYDEDYGTSSESAGAAAGFAVLVFFLIILCCTGVICCMLCRKKTRPRQPVAMGNLTSEATVPLQSQQPVVHPPPPSYKDVVGPTTESLPPPGYNPNMGHSPAPYPTAPGSGYPPGPGYPPVSGAGYPPASGPGCPPTSGLQYPPTTGSGYPPASGPGYPPSSGLGYPPTSGTEHPSASPGYPPASGTGYPTEPGPGHATAAGPGFPSASGPGWPYASDSGDLPPKNSGYLPGSGPGYQSVPPPSFAPIADDSSIMAPTDGNHHPAEEHGRPAPSAPPPPDDPTATD